MTETGAAETVGHGHSVTPLPDRLGVGQSLLDGAVTPSRRAPMTASFANPRIADARVVQNGEIVTVQLNADALKDRPSKRDLRISRKFDKDKTVQELLGPIVRDTINLQETNGRMIDGLRDLQGRFIRWEWWAPAKRMLISRFRSEREFPSDDEMEHRRAWCEKNEIKWYSIDWSAPKFSISDIRRLLADEAALTQGGV